MARLHYDNALGTLGAALAPGDTAINFGATAPPFATLTGDDYIPLVMGPPIGRQASLTFEVVHLTAYTAGQTTGTIVRGQEITTAVAHGVGDAWLCTPTAQDLGSGLPTLQAVKAVATANIAALTGTATTIDGQALAVGDRVLLAGQTTASQNGIWVVQTGAWTRPLDYPSGGVISGRTVTVLAGTNYAQSDWQLTATSSFVIDTGSSTWNEITDTNALHWKGVYSGQSAYKLNDVVTYAGQLLRANQAISVAAEQTPTFVGVATTHDLATATALAFPAGSAAGNVALLAMCGSGFTSTTYPAAPAGWTVISQTTLGSAFWGNNISMTVCARVLTAGDITTGSVTVPGFTGNGNYHLRVYNSDGTDQFVATTSTSTGNITPANPAYARTSELAVAFVGGVGSTGAGTYAWGAGGNGQNETLTRATNYGSMASQDYIQGNAATPVSAASMSGGSGSWSNVSTVSIFGYVPLTPDLTKWDEAVPGLLTPSVNTVAASGAALTLPDVTAATIHRVVLTANCTFTFPAAATGKWFEVVLVQDATGTRTATWPASVKWPGGAAPTLTATAGKADRVAFECVDGATWYGQVVGQNY